MGLLDENEQLEQRVVNIVLLANKDRLIRLFNRSEVQNTGKVHVAKCLDEAFPVISAKGQNLVFIQERLGEMSGELLAYRIGSELKEKKARIVLLGDPQAFPVTGKKPFHAVLDTALDDKELYAAILELLSNPVGRKKRSKVSAKSKVTPQSAEGKPVETEPPPRAETVEDVATLRGPSSSAAGYAAWQEQAASPVLPKSSFQTKLESALDGAGGAKEASRRTVPLVPPEPFSGPIRVTWGKPTFRSRLRDFFLRPKALLVLVPVLAGLLGLLVFLLSPQQRPAAPGSSVATSGAEGKVAARPFLAMPGALPSFLPRLSADPDYGKANPGWECYRDSSTEYRVYRQKGLIRAFQIIDRSGQGISPGLLTSALTEISGSSQYVTETTERKGTYLVEKGRVINGDGIILYRKEPERSVKAFVLDLK
jgi:hypothetical protein